MNKVLVSLCLLLSGCASAIAKPPENLTVLDSKTIQLVGVIEDGLVSKLQEQIMLSKEPTLVFYLKSPGGSIDAGNNLINVVKATGKPTKCVVDFAASMAFVFTQLACDERIILPSGTLMQHQASYSLSQAPAERQKSMIKMVEDLVLNLEIQQAARMGITLAEFQARRNNDYWLVGAEAVRDNAADKVGFALCTGELIRKRIRAKRQVFIFEIETERSACPILNDEKVVEPAKQEAI